MALTGGSRGLPARPATGARRAADPDARRLAASAEPDLPGGADSADSNARSSAPERAGDHAAGANVLRLFRRESPVTVLGPGRRAVIWVQGCPFACRGCIVPESWAADTGDRVPIGELVDWISEQPGIEGITLSGGEPMEQAGPLAELIDRVRRAADLGVVCYTGHTLETLRKAGRPDRLALLDRCDLLIDGVYIESRHADLRWRGSANQRLIPLTDRYRAEIERIRAGEDRTAGMEFFVDDRGAFGFAGVPHRAGFRAEFEARLAGSGVKPG
ncbi:MAG TPA: 4Fe-4S single cluster domain-containing protein [Chthonomonadaceae bacterium]|nr:4Fe-4S single cluster domain-containing protein [Chthonomonadaceae bacterium]